ncbi:MAG: TIR domain-containing protein, partial [Planctomycetota bacterium]
EQQGDIVVWDDRKIKPGEDWYPAIKDELEESAVAICLISADYLSSDFINKDEIPELKIRRSRDGMLILPILVRPCPWKTVQWLKTIQMFPRDGKSLAEIRGKVRQEKALSEIAEHVYEKIKDPAFQIASPAPKWPAPEKVDIERLPQTGMELFGRKKELELLDKAWKSGETIVISLVAGGGFGKSTLVNKWLELMALENYRGAKSVFGWSFYSQGTKERVTSADKFISEALAWFGDADPKKGSPWDKGQRLADLIRIHKTLLILDGLEPLQSDVEGGKIKDPALSFLVTQLARKNNGLCVITTRLDVAELGRFDKGVEQLNLDQISKEAGRALLRVGGVQGTDEELQAASAEFGNHALAVNLLASYIHDLPGHHISNAGKIEDLDIPVEEGKHPRRVIEAFEKRFGKGQEVQRLRILGLFDRPVEMDAIKAVYDGRAIKSLTDKLVNLTEGQWQNLFEKLRGYRLLARKSTHRPDIVDCHPLIREHFGEKLQKSKPKAWKEAHGRLYEYYKNVPEKEYPDTLEEMEPLFSAVSHGCQAGRHQETFDDVYWKRIKRGNEQYSTAKLGAFGTDLAAVSGFLEKPWSRPASGLTEREKALVLNISGFELRALGRLKEATEPIKVGMQLQVEQEDWQNVSIAAGNLSELYLTLGKVNEAVDYARQAVKFAERSGEMYNRVGARTTFANALHQKGEIFEEAETLQKKRQPNHPLLYSTWGFKYCDLLFSQGKFSEVIKRTVQTLEWSISEGYLLEIAVEYLSLGHGHLLRVKQEGSSDYRETEDFLNQAVDGLRESGNQDDVPRGLLARAELFRYRRSWEKAWADSEEAKEIAQRGEMNLYLADYHLESARLCLAQGKTSEARRNCEEAAKRVEDMGYHRRDPEVLLIKAELQIVEGDEKRARETLANAKKLINKMGCHRWDIEVERLNELVNGK